MPVAGKNPSLNTVEAIGWTGSASRLWAGGVPLSKHVWPVELLRGGFMILLRRELGDVLRDNRQAQGRTLREVSASAAVSLGYLSEVERGEKEASSELLASICAALNLPMSRMLSHVSDRVAESEAVSALVTLPVGQRSDTMVRASAA
jgi:hypothetical protein